MNAVPDDDEFIEYFAPGWLDTVILLALLAGFGIAAACRWSFRNWDELLLRAAMVGSVAACLYALGGI